MKKMFVLLGDTPGAGGDRGGQRACWIETELATGSMDRVEMRDPAKRYHIMTIAELQKLSPDFDWQAYLNGIERAGEDDQRQLAAST